VALDPSELLTERRFWNVISRSLDGTDSVSLRAARQEELLAEQLNRLTKREFTGFIGHFYRFFHRAYRRDLWAAAYIVMGGCSDDCFIDFRKWLVMRGQRVYEAAVRDPDSLSPEFDKIPHGDIPLWEYYFHSTRFGENASNEAYEQFEFGPVESADPENDWDSDDEQRLQQLCPRIYEGYWDDLRF